MLWLMAVGAGLLHHHRADRLLGAAAAAELRQGAAPHSQPAALRALHLRPQQPQVGRRHGNEFSGSTYR